MKIFYLYLAFLVLPTKDIFGRHPINFILKVNFSTTESTVLYIGEAIFLKQLCAATIDNPSSVGKNGQFIFKGKLLYPTAVRIFSNDRSIGLNTLFFIDTGYQEINIVRDSNNSMFKVISNTRINNEYHQFITSMKVLNSNQHISEKPFELYVEENPKSYVALFTLFDQAFNYGLSPGLKKISNKFHLSLQSNEAFKAFINEQCFNKKMPSVKVRNEKHNDIDLQFVRSDKKFTFIEFWYAGCTSCVPVMQELKDKYLGLKDKICFLSINTDAKNNFKKSVKVLNDLKLPWINYWDFDSEIFGRIINLYVYPSNLLINSDGIAVGKNIDISKIEEFLREFNTEQQY